MTATTAKWRRADIALMLTDDLERPTVPDTRAGIIRNNIGIYKVDGKFPEWRIVHQPSGITFADRGRLRDAKDLADRIEAGGYSGILDRLAAGEDTWKERQDVKRLRMMCRDRQPEGASDR